MVSSSPNLIWGEQNSWIETTHFLRGFNLTFLFTKTKGLRGFMASVVLVKTENPGKMILKKDDDLYPRSLIVSLQELPCVVLKHHKKG